MKKKRKNSGEKFKALVRKLKAKGYSKSPKALAAWIGRKKYGKKKFAAMARTGKKAKRKGKIVRLGRVYHKRRVAANSRYSPLIRSLSARGDVRSPEALGAWLGRHKHWKKRFSVLARHGRWGRNPDLPKNMEKEMIRALMQKIINLEEELHTCLGR